MKSQLLDEVVPIFEFPGANDTISEETENEAQKTLESGGVLFSPSGGFSLSKREKELFLNASVTLPTRRERKSKNGRPTIIFEPGTGKIVSGRLRSPEREELQATMTRYSQWAEALIKRLIPAYSDALVRDRITFRPCERSKPQGLHVDSSYGRPTEGNAMLRVFCNVNPSGIPRKWQIGEKFEPFAKRYIGRAKINDTSFLQQKLHDWGLVHGRRTAYDNLLADIRSQGKKDEDFQKNSPRRVIDFPVGAAWIAITDLALHGALAGQYSLDQTFFLPITAMNDPDKSSLNILERLSGKKLV